MATEGRRHRRRTVAEPETSMLVSFPFPLPVERHSATFARFIRVVLINSPAFSVILNEFAVFGVLHRHV